MFVPLEFVLQPLYITKSYYTYFHIAYQITCIYIISILYKSTPKLHVHMYNRFATTTCMETSLLPLCRISYGPYVVGSPYTNKHIKQSIIVSFFCIHILCCFDPIIMPHHFTSIYQDQPVLIPIRRAIRRSLDWVGKSDEFLYSAWTL